MLRHAEPRTLIRGSAHCPLPAPAGIGHLSATCEQLAECVEFYCQSRAVNGRSRFKSGSGNHLILAGCDLADLCWKCFEQPKVYCDLNVSTERSGYLGIVGQGSTAVCDRRVRKCPGFRIVSQGLHERYREV